MKHLIVKKFFACLCISSLIVTMTACSGNTTGASSANTAENSSASASSSQEETAQNTVTGQVTAIDGTKVTLLLGTLEEPQRDENGTPPEMPEGENGGGRPDGTPPADGGGGNPPGGQPDGTPPEKPAEENAEASDKASEDASGQAAEDENNKDTDAVSSATEKKDGAPPSGNGTDGTPPEGGAGDGRGQRMGFTAGEETAEYDLDGASFTMDGPGKNENISMEDITVDTILVLELGEDDSVKSVTVKMGGAMRNGANGGEKPDGNPSGRNDFGGSGEVTQGTAAATIENDGEISGETYSSTGDDENALRISKADVTLDGITVDKSAGETSNTEDGDFYGMNAALLATDGAAVTIKNATVTSSAQNGNGVFSYGENTSVTISDSEITTSADNSGGIQTTGGASTTATNLTVNTAGNSSAAIRSDRGGGTVVVDQGTYTSSGYNSPAVYSTADITVSNATLTAANSEALVIEGKNSISLKNCIVSGNMSDDKGASSDENVHNVMIYQSMSGDADVGTSSFSMTGGSLTSENGDLFYITNTHALITLTAVEITNHETDGNLLTISGNSASHGWGTAGANGAQAELTADSQTLEGKISVDSISSLKMALTGGSSFTGTINISENAEGGTAVSDNAILTIEEGSSWTLTGDCTLTSLTNEGTINYNGFTITLADGTVLTQ